MQVKGDNGIEFELADEVATAMITAGILEEVISDEDALPIEASPSSEDMPADEGDTAEETSKKSKK